MESNTKQKIAGLAWKTSCILICIVAGATFIQYSIEIEETLHSNIMRYNGCKETQITYAHRGFEGATQCITEPHRTLEEMQAHAQVDIRFYTIRTLILGLLFVLTIYIYQKN